MAYIQEKYLQMKEISYHSHDISKSSNKKDQEYFNYVSKSYPETWSEGTTRTKMIQKDLYWTVRNKKPAKGAATPEKLAILCFGHGAMVKQFSQINRGNPSHTETPGYCAITAMYVKNKRSDLVFNMYEDHMIKSMESFENY